MMKTVLIHLCFCINVNYCYYEIIIMLSLHVSPGEWSSPNVTGQSPPPCSSFSLTQVGERRAALFGGWSDSRALFVVELSRHTVVSVVRKQYHILNFVLVDFCWAKITINIQLLHFRFFLLVKFHYYHDQ